MWKDEIRLSDLPIGRKFEVTCKVCKLFRYELAGDLMLNDGFEQFFLDQVEAALNCRSKHCSGAQRVALTYDHLLEGFIHGMP